MGLRIGIRPTYPFFYKRMKMYMLCSEIYRHGVTKKFPATLGQSQITPCNFGGRTWRHFVLFQGQTHYWRFHSLCLTMDPQQMEVDEPAQPMQASTRPTPKQSVSEVVRIPPDFTKLKVLMPDDFCCDHSLFIRCSAKAMLERFIWFEKSPATSSMP